MDDLLVVAAEKVGDLDDGEVMVVGVGDGHIALECHGLPTEVLHVHGRQVRARLRHLGDLVHHHFFRFVHPRRHIQLFASLLARSNTQ